MAQAAVQPLAVQMLRAVQELHDLFLDCKVDAAQSAQRDVLYIYTVYDIRITFICNTVHLTYYIYVYHT